MKELSLHVLDIARNSIEAGANIVSIRIDENLELDLLTIEIEDNGKGIDRELIEKVTDPFFTTRKTRSVGLGLALAKESAIHCDGDFKIESEKGKGTKVIFSYRYSHIDRAPLGNMGQTIMTLISFDDDIEILYKHMYNNAKFNFDTRNVKKVLNGININESRVLIWIKDYINESIFMLYS
ncbi:ATP-binding protein [Sporanaerobacter acetigenes]|uniref:histidine kinase n=1 Tax=Sporanaerobacter acetigenes DSM 13106 TaxID=1123281 RepID=A0A1M5UY79_9FIRM|nr:ATP-binding protein [Sporanaerobacter acetigenes]SHH67951.1 Histidine kinase-, DNA gyrase B-, and HSP90-like ATPase [Sporanaerobacter acetigenes DSM 13106]